MTDGEMMRAAPSMTVGEYISCSSNSLVPHILKIEDINFVNSETLCTLRAKR